MFRPLSLVRPGCQWIRATQRPGWTFTRTWCDMVQDEEEVLKARLDRIQARRSPVVNEAQGKEVVDDFLERREEKSKYIDEILEPHDETNYQPLFDPKYNPKRLTEKSSTYMDIIRLTSKAKVDIPMDPQVADTKAFNYTLLQLFQVGNVEEARDYFFQVTARKDSPAQRSSYNIAIAEFVNAGEVFLAEVLLNFLKESSDGPDVVSFNSMISGCVMYSSLEGAMRYIEQMKDYDVTPNHQTNQYLMALHLKLGQIDQARALADQLGESFLPEYTNDLFARALAQKADYQSMREYAWGSATVINDHTCTSIADVLVDRLETQELDQLLQQMDKNGRKLGWSVGQKVLRHFSDQRNGTSLNPLVESLLGRIVDALNDKERLEMIRAAIIEEREEEVVFRKRKRRAPIWKRKVEYKNPADTAWDTLIQEYLAEAYRDQKLRKGVAKHQRVRAEQTRKPDEEFFKKPVMVMKTRVPWKL